MERLSKRCQQLCYRGLHITFTQDSYRAACFEAGQVKLYCTSWIKGRYNLSTVVTFREAIALGILELFDVAAKASTMFVM